MKSKLKITCCTFIMLLVSANVSSIEVVSTYTKITQIYPTSNRFVFDTEYSNTLSTCENGKRWSISDSIDEKYFQAQLSSILAAFMSNKDVLIIFDDAQGASCYPAISRFQVK